MWTGCWIFGSLSGTALKADINSVMEITAGAQVHSQKSLPVSTVQSGLNLCHVQRKTHPETLLPSLGRSSFNIWGKAKQSIQMWNSIWKAWMLCLQTKDKRDHPAWHSESLSASLTVWGCISADKALAACPFGKAPSMLKGIYRF